MDLFSVTAPLVIRLPDGRKRIMVEKFPHAIGLLYFEPFWHEDESHQLIHLAEGELRGEGPWKVGDCVVTVVGCHGTDPELAMEFSSWQEYLTMVGGEYCPPKQILDTARRYGAFVL